MYSGTKVNLFIEITRSEFYTILSRHLQELSCVDCIYLIKYADSPYIKSSALNFKMLQGIEVIEIDPKPTDKTFEIIRSLAKEDEINMFIGTGVLHITPKWDYMLCSLLEEDEPLCPYIVGTSRATYLAQVMGILPSWLTKPFYAEYIDEFEVYDLPPDCYHQIHTQNIELIESGKVSKYNIGRRYVFQAQESKPMEMIVWKGTIPASAKKPSDWLHFKKMSMISSVVASHWVGEPNHPIVNKYSDINPKPKQKSVIADDSDMTLPIGLMLQNSSPDEFEPKIAISTCKDQLYVSVPSILQSIINLNKVDPSDVLVVVGDCEEEKIEVIAGVTYSYVTHNSFDHNAIIDIVEKDWAASHWFIMHDTSRMGPKMMKNIMKMGSTKSHIPLLKEGWLNTGLFSKKYIRSLAPYILSLKNCGKMQAILSERVYVRFDVEDKYFDTTEPENLKVVDKVDVYGDGIERLIIHFVNSDFYKYQRYYHMSPSVMQLIDEHLVK